jgi:DNA invertase Pin-like site-specific DNA recombinase
MSQQAIIYARFSTAAQAEGTSLKRQLENGRRYVGEKGWTLDREISDLGRSAFHGANRAEGSDLHQFEIEARQGLHEGKVLCVENLDRLSRQGIKAAAKLVWSLNDSGVDVATWYDGNVYKAKSDSDLADIVQIAVISQRSYEESLTKSRRGKLTWKERYEAIGKKEPGTRSGRPPAWLDWDGEKYVENAHRCAVLREIFDLYLSGIGTYKIVQLLNERQEPSWPNKKVENQKGWYLPYVGGLIRNRAVLGEYVTLKGEVISTDYYPRVIAQEAFVRANEIMSGRTAPRGRHGRHFKNLLSGLPRCSACDGTAAYENKGENSFTKHVLATGETTMYARKTYERLRCDNNRRHKGCGNGELFDYQVIERALLDRLLEIAVDENKDTRSTTLQMLDEKIIQVTREIEVETQRARNIVRQMAGETTSRFVKMELDEIEQKVEQLEADLKAHEAERLTETHKPALVDDAKLIADTMADLRNEDMDLRYAARTKVNMALRRIVDEVLISPDGTFTVLADIAVWQFDKLGNVIGGQAL